MKYITEVLCPVCGRTMSRIVVDKETTDKKEGLVLKALGLGEKKDYLDYLSERWDLNKSEWGLIREAKGGRGSGFPIIDWLKNPEDAPELHQKLKKQLLNGLKWWLNKGWISQKEIEKIF